MRRAFALLLLLALMLPLPALAQASKPLSTHKDWTAFAYTDKGKKVCYVASRPVDSEPKNIKRGDIYFLVTMRPADKVLDEVSVVPGYPFKENSEVQVEVDGKKFDLFTDAETAWSKTAQVDKAIVQAMVKGNDLVVRGASARGTKTTDRFSLQGFKAAHEAIAKACAA